MTIDLYNIPLVTVEKMQEIDRLMVRKFGLNISQTMETAGKCFTELTKSYFHGSIAGKKIGIIAGKGNKGGAGLASTRYLAQLGADVTILVKDKNFDIDTMIQWQSLQDFPIVKKINQKAVEYLETNESDLLLDALLGYGFNGNPEGFNVQMIQKMNASTIPVLSLDVPSGFDVTRGIPGQPCTKAYATLTLGLPKQGMFLKQASVYMGQIFLADIGVPPALYRELEIESTSLFRKGTIIDLPDLHHSTKCEIDISLITKSERPNLSDVITGSTCLVLG